MVQHLSIYAKALRLQCSQQRQDRKIVQVSQDVYQAPILLVAIFSSLLPFGCVNNFKFINPFQVFFSCCRSWRSPPYRLSETPVYCNLQGKDWLASRSLPTDDVRLVINPEEVLTQSGRNCVIGHLETLKTVHGCMYVSPHSNNDEPAIHEDNTFFGVVFYISELY
ncbi:hypothetical protein C8R44DRAFT_750824 [Mycena epipterygia]|nr:hypothetical protein C8R44DRAFT_750824 [Mycena epipterygia]